MHLVLFLPSVALGAIVSVTFAVYACWRTFYWSPRSRGAPQAPVDGAVSGDRPSFTFHRVKSFSWQRLQVTLKGGDRRTIIHASCGRTLTGELTAIIGPSGKRLPKMADCGVSLYA